MIGTTSFQNQQDFFKSIIKPKEKISLNIKDSACMHKYVKN